MQSTDLLVIAAHPDDAELFCGGTIAKMADSGYRVAILDLTAGELASNGSVAGRRKESEAAAALLGLSLRKNLALPDGGLSPESSQQLRALAGTLREIRPGLIMAPYYRARHPDHSAAGLLAKKALFFAGLKKYETEKSGDAVITGVPLIYYQMRYSFRPSFLVDISDVSDKKYEAVSCYSSQLVRSDQASPTLLNEPLSLSSLKARDAYLGAMIGASAAEGFLVEHPLAVNDPVGFFKDNLKGGPLFFQEPV
ncbi:MAG: bacillithiol biosynthesis deacetylase BshB1 [Candidatus Dadabacteria bacterium]|nr:MAG: bacillithiol biosynthesis deacetylase BshB1 [Candidatus Dadabacteria bacterium]